VAASSSRGLDRHRVIPAGTCTIAFGKAGAEPCRERNVFIEVDRPRRIVFQSTMFMVEDGRNIDTTVTATFEDRGGRTLLTIVQTFA